MEKPVEGEYASYYQPYIDKVEEMDLLPQLTRSKEQAMAIFDTIQEEKAKQRYAPDKWTIKELLGHLIDSERVFAYRAMSIARGEKQSLPGYDENAYVAAAAFNQRTWESLIEEYSAVRKSTCLLFAGMPEELAQQRGIANGKEVSVRALAAMIIGHEKHHLNILQERYLLRT